MILSFSPALSALSALSAVSAVSVVGWPESLAAVTNDA